MRVQLISLFVFCDWRYGQTAAAAITNPPDNGATAMLELFLAGGKTDGCGASATVAMESAVPLKVRIQIRKGSGLPPPVSTRPKVSPGLVAPGELSIPSQVATAEPFGWMAILTLGTLSMIAGAVDAPAAIELVSSGIPGEYRESKMSSGNDCAIHRLCSDRATSNP